MIDLLMKIYNEPPGVQDLTGLLWSAFIATLIFGVVIYISLKIWRMIAGSKDELPDPRGVRPELTPGDGRDRPSEEPEEEVWLLVKVRP